MARVRAQVSSAKYPGKLTYCAIYSANEPCSLVDIALECVPAPRVFEWNLLHRDMLSQCCVDIDGVLCRDPSAEENDDGESYRTFISTVSCQVRPTYMIGHLVSARLERYRDQTVGWLTRNGIKYRELHLLGLPDAEVRRTSQVHASFKASVYRRIKDAPLFIESDTTQAVEIANRSGKPVLCYMTRTMHYPGTMTAQLRRGARRAASVARSLAARLRRT
jgi:orotate phosphoribosyltransferase